MTRLDFARRATAWGLLLGFWGVMLLAFAAHVLPRLRYLTGAPIAGDLPCHKPECDFSIFWPAGILARAGDFAQLYSASAFPDLSAHMLGTSARLEPFLYPPPMLLPATAVSFLPFETGAFVWMLGSLILAAALLRWARLPWPVIAAGLLSPAALLGTEIGQTGVLEGAVLVAGLTALTQRPRTAGGLLGLLVLKPQTGILLPFVFLARRDWRAAAACALAVAALTALTTALFGPAVWRAFLTADHAASVLTAPFDAHTYQGWGVSVFWMARSLGASVALAWTAQALTSAAAIAALFRGPSTAAAVCLSLLATPYGFTYDMVGYSLILVWSVHQRAGRLDVLDAALFLWPGLCLVVSIATGILLTPLMVLALLLRTAVLPAPAQE
jgi:hypothetical protein